MSGVIRVLVVASDQSHHARMAEELDDRTGIVVTQVETARVATEAVEAGTVDCVVTAEDLSDSDGVSLLESIRTETRGVGVVLLVESSSEETAVAALNAGADAYHRTGVTVGELRKSIEQAASERSTRDQHRKAQTVLDSLFEQFPEHMHLYLKDGEARHVRVTDTFADAETWLGKTDYEVTGVPPGECESYQDDLTVIEAGTRISSKDEQSGLTDRRLRTSKLPWYDGENVVGLVGITQDVTERTRQKRRLERLTERFELALEATGAGVIDWNLETLDINLHGSAASLLGIDENRTTLELSDLLDSVHPDDRGRIERLTDSVCGSGRSFQIEYRIERDGGWRWIECHGELYRGDDGTETRAIGILSDATERKARERHREQQQQQITALHSVAIDLQHCDTDTEICERTIEAARKILSFDQCVITLQDGDELPIEASSEGIAVEDLDPMGVDEGISGKTYQTKDSFLIDDVNDHPDATPRDDYGGLLSVPVGDHGVFQAVSNEVEAFDDEDLELAELLVTHTDTALNRLVREQALEQQTAELQRQNDRLDRFASIVSHDLRNPLQVAQGHLELSDHDDDHLQTVGKMHERMETLLTELLALAREGDRVTETEPIELETAASTCWRSVETADATLTVDDDCTIHGDRQSVRQLLENLFRNAVDHSESPVTVRVGSISDGFYIADDGPGISPSIRSDVFEAGFSTAEDGTGYGLNIVSEIVNAHGWTIDVAESWADGARFEIHDVETAQCEPESSEQSQTS